ncbi:MAG: YbhB/YbcL family Raf kinase inhibitor-like protein [Dehalococcoidia bacterium]
MRTRSRLWATLALGLLAIAAAACARDEPATPRPVTTTGPESAALALTVTSSAFEEGAAIPVRFTCDGEDVSPDLSWSRPPEGTVSIALVVDDPDAPRGVFTHWVAYGLPAIAGGMPEGVAPRPKGAGFYGKNDFGKTGYRGPCPPKGSPHTYRFTVYALDASPGLESDASQADLFEAIDGHVIARGRLTGEYKRP